MKNLQEKKPSTSSYLLRAVEKLPSHELDYFVGQILILQTKRHSGTLKEENIPRPQWKDIAGIAEYPLVGEDAQDWVSRNRQEGDQQREEQWRK